MFIKIFILLFGICGISAISEFFEKGQRAEFFELTDNEIPEFKLYISNLDFSLLKGDITGDYDNDVLEYKIKNDIKDFLNFLEKINFYTAYPDIDFSNELPNIKFNEEGLLIMDIDKILKGYEGLKDSFDNILTDENRIGSIINIVLNYSDFDLKSIVEFIINNVDLLMDNNIFNRCVDFILSITSKPLLNFKTKKATLKVNINGKFNNFDKVTLKIGGNSSHFYGKPGFNIKIRGGKNLFGRSQFKIRNGARDPTFLRSKIASDIHNRLGLPSISANYIILYINDEYMGLYTLMDAYKLSWIEYNYGEKNSTSLINCSESFENYLTYSHSRCINENEDITDLTEWENFLNELDNAESASDIEDILDIDQFLKEIALEYLFGSWDHFPNKSYSHNYYMYKPENDKWKYLIYDFDADFGQEIFYPNLHCNNENENSESTIGTEYDYDDDDNDDDDNDNDNNFYFNDDDENTFLPYETIDLDEEIPSETNDDYFDDDYETYEDYLNDINEDLLKDDLFKYRFSIQHINPEEYSIIEWIDNNENSNYNHLIEILIYKDPTRIKNILKNIINEIFNPATLFPHIDEIKEFIRPYIEKEKIINANGYYPGVMKNDSLTYTLHEWDISTEFTNLSNTYGLKYWIIAKYRNVCNFLHIECDPYYMNEFTFENNLYLDKTKNEDMYKCYTELKSEGNYDGIPIITNEN